MDYFIKHRERGKVLSVHVLKKQLDTTDTSESHYMRKLDDAEIRTVMMVMIIVAQEIATRSWQWGKRCFI